MYIFSKSTKIAADSLVSLLELDCHGQNSSFYDSHDEPILLMHGLNSHCVLGRLVSGYMSNLVKFFIVMFTITSYQN